MSSNKPHSAARYLDMFNRNQNSREMWLKRVSKSASQPALYAGDLRLSWIELDQQLQIIESNLRAMGIRSSAIFVLVGKGSVQQTLIYLALLRASHLCSVVSSDEASGVILNKLETIEASFYLTTDDIDIDHSATTSKLLSWKHLRWKQVLSGTLFEVDEDQPSVFDKVPEIEPLSSQHQNISSIVFTSGSTGEPKAVAHRAYSHVVSAIGVCEEMGLSRTDNWMLTLPLSHVSGIAILWRWITCGGRLTLPESRHNQLGDSNFSSVTVVSWVSTQLQQFLDSEPHLLPQRQNVKILLGGSHFSESLIECCNDHQFRAWLGYGLTEAASTVCAKSIDSNETVGTPLLEREVELNGGEICIKSDILALGYLSGGIIRPLPLQDNYYHTSDMGYWIKDELKIIGRKGNMYISGGENIFCEEVESALKTMNGVNDVIVVPISDAKYGQIGVAVIQSLELLSKQEYTEFLIAKLAKFKIPKVFVLLPNMFNNGGIKLPRQEINAWAKTQKLPISAQP